MGRKVIKRRKKKRKLHHIVYHNKEDLMEDVVGLIEIKAEKEKFSGYVQGMIDCPKCGKMLHYLWTKLDGINRIECSNGCLYWKKRKLLHIKEPRAGLLIP